jgi:hypothetical protein
MSETIYAGPAKVYRDATGYFPEGENGQVDFSVDQEKLPVSTALHGQVKVQQGDCTGKISFTPADNWGLLPKLYPPYLGASVGATAGVLAIGTKLVSGAALKSTTVWVPGDTRSYTAVNTGIVKPSDLHLGVGKALYGPMDIAAVGDPAKQIGAAGFLYSVVENGAADPGGQFTLTDFIRERWTLSFGVVADYAAMETEDEWTVSCEVKTQAYKVQKLTRLIKLTSVAWMIKGKIVGPTHTQLDTLIGVNGGRVLGSSFGSADAVLTSTSGKIITLKNADAVGVGYLFGGSRLGTGETGFVNAMSLTAGVSDPLITFSV